MNEDVAREIAACTLSDPLMSSITPDSDVAEEIAQVLLKAYGESRSDPSPKQAMPSLRAALHEPRLLTTGPMARRLRVPVRWLKAEAEAERVPHLKADTVLLFEPDAVERVLVERARGEMNHAETA